MKNIKTENEKRAAAIIAKMNVDRARVAWTRPAEKPAAPIYDASRVVHLPPAFADSAAVVPAAANPSALERAKRIIDAAIIDAAIDAADALTADAAAKRYFNIHGISGFLDGETIANDVGKIYISAIVCAISAVTIKRDRIGNGGKKPYYAEFSAQKKAAIEAVNAARKDARQKPAAAAALSAFADSLRNVENKATTNGDKGNGAIFGYLANLLASLRYAWNYTNDAGIVTNVPKGYNCDTDDYISDAHTKLLEYVGKPFDSDVRRAVRNAAATRFDHDERPAGSLRAVSIDNPVKSDDDVTEWETVFPYDFVGFAFRDNSGAPSPLTSKTIADAMRRAGISARDENIVRRVVMNGEKQVDVAELYGINQSNVSRTIKATIEKLRAVLTE